LPFAPPPSYLLKEVTNGVICSPVLQKWNATFPELSDITDFLSQAIDLSKIIDERAVGAEIWKDGSFVSTSFNAVVHQLLSLPRHTEVINKGIPSPQLVMREAMRRACMILFALLRDKFSVRPSGISEHRNRVKELFIQHPIDWSDFLELRLWILFTSSLAAEDHELSWYIANIETTVVQMTIYGWKESIEVVRGILWMEQAFQVRNDTLKDTLELSISLGRDGEVA
jgi:hypothetical protein